MEEMQRIVGNNPSPVPAVDVRLAALRFPCSRLQAQGLPSVANPFSGAKAHWAFAYIRFTPLAPLRACTSPARLVTCKDVR